MNNEIQDGTKEHPFNSERKFNDCALADLPNKTFWVTEYLWDNSSHDLFLLFIYYDVKVCKHEDKEVE